MVMARRHVWLLALLLAGCSASQPERSPGIAGTVWVSHLFPAVVDTLAFDGDGMFRWYGAELDLTDTGTYRRAGDTLFLEVPETAAAREEDRGQGSSWYKLVARAGTLELVYAQHGIGAPPLKRFDPPFVFTPLAPMRPASP